MTPVTRQVEKTSAQSGESQEPDPQEKDFPPLREKAPSAQETADFRDRVFDQYHEALSKLADS